MGIKAGFAEADITPPLGTHKIGWLKDIVSDRVLDPLSARVMVMESDGARVAFVQLDTALVLRDDVIELRSRVAHAYGFPGENVLCAATHNHAGPAVAGIGDVERDEAYVKQMLRRTVDAFGEALDGMRDAQVAFGSAFEFEVPHNRRVVMRDGTVRTHGTFEDPDALYIEGPIDPELAVMAARGSDGNLLGAVVNFACHPTHHGGDTCLSAGFPGELAREMKQRGCPVTLFLNGASGNISDHDPTRGGARMSKEHIGRALADDVGKALEGVHWQDSLRLGCRSDVLALPYRNPTEDQVSGTARGAQRFIDSAIYERAIPALVERIRREGTQPAEVQVIFMDEYAWTAVPAEYFVQLGLRIKEKAHPRHALVVGYANGMVGYVPHREAFERGGYETTFAPWSPVAPGAGEMLAQEALELIALGP